MTDIPWRMILIGILLILSAGFSCAETAFLSLSRLQLSRLKKARPGRLDFWEADPDRVLAGILLWNSLTNVGLGVLATSVAVRMETAWGVPFRIGGWLVPAAVAIAVIIFGEILPKVVARNFSEPIALFLAPPVKWLTKLLGPS